MTAHLHIDRTALTEFCRAHRIRRLSLFGSALRDDFGPTSDIDFLVEFEDDARVTYLDLAEMEIELARLIDGDHKIDLRTPAELSRYFRQQVMDTAEVQYVAA